MKNEQFKTAVVSAIVALKGLFTKRKTTSRKAAQVRAYILR